jgi:hypothetical protein
MRDVRRHFRNCSRHHEEEGTTVSSRNYTTALVVLIPLGAGALWVLSDSAPPSVNGSYSVSSSDSPKQWASPESAIPPTPAVVEDNSTTSQVDEPQPKATPSSESVGWSTTTLAFSEREDPDPALSRQVESAIHRSAGAKMDPLRVEARSIECRGQTCQILLVSRATPAGSVSPTVVAAILRDLNDTSIQNLSTGAQVLSTGAQVGRLTLQEIRTENAGLVTLLGLGKP